MDPQHAVEEPSGPEDVVDQRDEVDRFGSKPELFGLALVAIVAWIILTQTG